MEINLDLLRRVTSVNGGFPRNTWDFTKEKQGKKGALNPNI